MTKFHGTHAHTPLGQRHLRKVCMRNGEALEFLKPHAPLSSDLEKSQIPKPRSVLGRCRPVGEVAPGFDEDEDEDDEPLDAAPQGAGHEGFALQEHIPPGCRFQERLQQYSGQDRPALKRLVEFKAKDEKQSSRDLIRCPGWEMPTSRSKMVLHNYRQHQKRRCSMHREPHADSIHV